MNKTDRQKFYDKVLEKAEGFSQHFLEGTRRGLAMMNLLGFKRGDYQIRTRGEGHSGGGWKPTSILINDHDDMDRRPNCHKVLELAGKVNECEFDVRAFYFKDKLNFIFLEEVFDRKGTVEKIYHLSGNKVRRVKEDK